MREGIDLKWLIILLIGLMGVLIGLVAQHYSNI